MNSIGRLLRERREAFGANLQDAAHWCGKWPEWLADKESSDDLSAVDFELICHGLAISPSALLRGGNNTPTRSVVRFRSVLNDPNILTPTDLRILATSSEIGLALGELLAAQGKELPFSQFRNIRGPLPGLQPWEDGYRLGEAARALLVPLEGPIFELETMLAKLGVHITRTRFSISDIEAASTWESGAVPVILLNSGATRVEYSFSRRAILAHEMCHLLHDGGEESIATRVTCAMGTCNSNEALEQRARGFAPAFLAPRRQVQEWGRNLSLPTNPIALVHEMAAYWGLSIEGAIWHAKNCSLIRSETADDLRNRDIPAILPLDKFERVGVDLSLLSAHPELLENVTPLMKGLATKLVLEALDCSAISLGRAKELLTWR